MLERARSIAQAELDLARVRRAKVSLIEPASAFSSATMPSQEPYRSAEAIRRVLPELRRLDRYERRAAVRRHRAVLDFFGGMKPEYNL